MIPNFQDGWFLQMCQLYNKFYMLLKIMYTDWRECISVFKFTPSELVFSTSLAISLFTPNKALFNSFETLVPARVGHYARLLWRSFQCIFVSIVNTSPPNSPPWSITLDSLLLCPPEFQRPQSHSAWAPHTGYAPARVCPIPVIPCSHCWLPFALCPYFSVFDSS